MIRTQRRLSGGSPRAVQLLRFVGLLGVVVGLFTPTSAGAQGGPRGARPAPPRAAPRARAGAQLPSPAAVDDEEPGTEPVSDPEQPPRV
ncbi:MAG: hypothetical protein ACMG6S_35800, partial [Byssovorax sp.]